MIGLIQEWRRGFVRKMRRRQAGSKRAVFRKLEFETLEERATPATFTVTNLNDSGPGSLRQAILDAEATTAADDIVVAAGISGTIFLQSELPTITRPLTIDGATTSAAPNDRLVVSGDAGVVGVKTDNVRIISITGTPAVTLKNLIFKDGNAQSDGANPVGGAIRITATSVINLENMLFEGNVAPTDGGAIHKVTSATAGQLNITDVRFKANEADFDNNGSGRGGAIYWDGGLMSVSETPSTGETLFDGNTAVQGGAIHAINGTIDIFQGIVFSGNGTATKTQLGGAISAMGGTPVTNRLENLNIVGANNNEVTFNGNIAGSGGAMYLGDPSTVGAYVVMDETTFANNVAQGDLATEGGGAIYANQVKNLTITNSSFSNNQAQGTSGRGGALYVDAKVGGPVALSNSSVDNNTAHSGGGIHFQGVAGTTMSVTDTAVTDNTATVDGGGYHLIDAGTFTIQTANIQTNIAGKRGGGIYNSDNVTLNITDGSISQNTSNGTSISEGGGGIFNDASGNVLLTNLQVLDNQATQGQASGAGIFNAAGATVDVNISSIVSNDAAQNGGGINNLGTLLVRGGTIIGAVAGVGTGNTAKLGAGIFNGTGGVATVTSSTIIDNTASESGGGFYNDTGATAEITNSTISFNDATGSVDGQGGGGVFNQGSIFLDNSSVDDNTATGGTVGAGGGILNTNFGVATMIRGTVDRNSADFGGAFRNRGPGAVLTFADTNMEENTAQNRGGAGDIIGGVASVNRGTMRDNTATNSGGGFANVGATFILKNSVVLRNTSQTDNGGGFFTDSGGITQISNATISLNRANGNDVGDGGGGIYNNGITFVTDSTVTANTAPGSNADGGGVLNTSAGTLNLIRGTISGNNAGRDGGGVSNAGGAFTIDNAHLIGNIAGRNGGGMHLAGTGSSLTLNDGSFRDNIAGEEGGGIWTEGTLNLTNVTMVNNVANGNTSDQGGGAIFAAGGTVNLTNGILDNNRAPGTSGSGGAIFNEGGTITATGTIIKNNSATLAGGGIEASGGTTTLNNVTLQDNMAGAFPTSLSPGDIIIIGYRSDDVDVPINSGDGDDNAIAWVPLVDLQPNQEIFFTDSGVKADGTFRGQEGAIKYTAPATGLAAGTVMLLEFSPGTGTGGSYVFNEDDPGSYSGANDANVGTNGLNLSTTGDNLFVFDGSTASPNFIFGLKTEDTTFDADSTADDETALPSSLTVGTNAVALGDDPDIDFDNARYNAATTGNRATLLTTVTTPANWEKSNTLPFTGPPNDNDITNGVTQFTISDLPTAMGGGLHSTGAATIDITGGIVEGNKALGEGGGLWTSGQSATTLIDVNVKANHSGQGGAVYQSGSGGGTGTLTIQTSLLEANTANEFGGGLYSAGATVNVNTSTVSGNAVSVSGGGVAVGGGITNLNSSTIAFNDAFGQGGGVHDTGGGTINATSTLIGNNTATGGAPDLNGTINGNFNLVEDTTGATVNGSTNILGRDPVIDTLADNGGPTKTHALLRGSPAIDTGLDAPSLGKDQRGQTRPFDSGGAPPPLGDKSDIGAFESQIPPIFLVGLQDGDTLVNFNDIGPANAQGVPIVGLMSGEKIIALDSRLADHKLYGVSDQGNIYQLDPDTGQATFVSSMSQGLNDPQAVTLDQSRHFFISDQGFSENSFGQGEKWLKGKDVTSTGNDWYAITPSGDLYKWQGVANDLGTKVAAFGSNVYDKPTLLTEAFDGFGSLTAAEQTALANFDQTHRLYRASTGDFYVNALGGNEKWIRGEENSFNNPWYIIEPNGNVREWDGGPTINTSPILDTFNSIIYEDPSILYTAFDRSASLPAGEQGTALSLDQNNDFFFTPTGNIYEDFLGKNEKWFLGDAVGGSGLSWYYVEPDGEVYRYVDGVTDPLVQDFDNVLWDKPSLLVKADDPFTGLSATQQDKLRRLDFLHGLFPSSNSNDYYFNAFGQQEKWLYGDTNQFGQNWYIIDTNFDLIAWNGGSGITGQVLDNVGQEAYENPDVLFEAYDRGAALGTFSLGTHEAGADFSPLADTIDFLSVNDSLRLVLDNGSVANFQIDVDTGYTQVDTAPPADRLLSAIAFDNIAPGATTTTLFTIDFVNDVLNTMNPETGALTAVGNLNGGVDFLDGGLEIGKIDAQNRALAVLIVDNGGQKESRLYEVNLTTGQVSPLGINDGLIGPLGTFDDINDVALAPKALDDLFGSP